MRQMMSRPRAGAKWANKTSSGSWCRVRCTGVAMLLTRSSNSSRPSDSPVKGSITTCPCRGADKLTLTKKCPGKFTPCASSPKPKANSNQITARLMGMPRRERKTKWMQLLSGS